MSAIRFWFHTRQATIEHPCAPVFHRTTRMSLLPPCQRQSICQLSTKRGMRDDDDSTVLEREVVKPPGRIDDPGSLVSRGVTPPQHAKKRSQTDSESPAD